MEIWHNPRCSKSRATLALIEESGVEPEVRRYVDDPPTIDELDAALRRLGKEPWEVCRMHETVAKNLNMADWPQDRQRWLDAMTTHPILIERPIVFADDGRAVLGRPPENVEELL
ncbi:MAG: arsenate reductase (glutaredoxin) [Nitriliruptorales bacterium]|nr:arsenate reductase (glutaredoxin) [Nitriliruptorales bacterium]